MATSRNRATALMFLGGLGFIAFAVWWYMSTTQFVDSAEQTSGTVVEMVQRTHWSEDHEGTATSRTLWHPVVSFTAGGEEVQFEGGQGARRPGYEIGESVTVAYDPARPHQAKIVSFGELYLTPLILGGIGVVSLTISAVAWRRGR